MPLPAVDRERILEAIKDFDITWRGRAEWARWEESRAQRYAIEYEGKRYPPKQIVSIATGAPVNTFSGGAPTNGYLEARGFRVISLRPRIIADLLEEILSGYPEAKANQTFGSEAPMYQTLKRLEQTLAAEEILGERKTLSVEASPGKGRWGGVPWVSFLDSRETDTTQRGVYVVILFRGDGSGLYLTFNQGVTEPQKRLGPAAGTEEIRNRAVELRQRAFTRELTKTEFVLDDSIDLRGGRLGDAYETSTIGHKFYAKGAIPDDARLLEDLSALFSAYEGYINAKAQMPTILGRVWIFQSNPEFFDTRAAVKELKQFRWLANQHQNEMRKGDRAYLWESGPNAGIVAVAEILEPMQVVDDDPASVPFDKEPDKFEGAQPRVLIGIQKIIDPHLSREAVKQHPALKDLSILKMPQGTNFPVTDKERDALEELLQAPRTRASAKELCLIGTWRHVEPTLERASRAIAERKAWASSWSFPIRAAAQSILKKPFYLYINAGGGRIPIRVRVTDYTTSQGNEGQVSPWPEITNVDWVGKTRSGTDQADIFKTWLRIDAVEKLAPELRISDFEPAQGLSVEGSLLSAVTFGYAYRRSEDPMEALVAYTLLERPFLEEIVSVLTRPVEAGGSPQIVLAGPPGTSKTWVAEAIARHIAGDANRVRLVQFHPNYSYEAFIEGLRPIAEGGGISFKRQDGALLDMVESMREAHETTPTSPLYALIVDEMNRANLPRVFGELMYLFEYRDKTIRLQYSETFSLPPNLRFIGTMNTADRSIRSIDIALRRRFDVFELKPDPAMLRRYFAKNPLNAANLVGGFEKLNQKLEGDLDRHHTIGHAFFMKPGLDRKMLRAIWDRKIYPLIEEYFFDQLDIARKEYVFETFWPE